MKNIMFASIAAGGLAVLVAGPATAQNTNRNSNSSANAAKGFTVENVDPVHPFGSINVYNVGLDPMQVSAWAKTLNAGQKQEMVGRCSVIVHNQQNYFLETTTFCQNFAIAIAESISGKSDASQ